jgi:hypothetical protein
MFASVATAAECTVRSGAQSVPVIELYTSEGCSSCPPADRWLSGLAGAAAAGRIVPLAFHVNYWDHIGWKDVFASDRATERQRGIQKAAGARFVYTPQVVLGGRDFPDWRSASWAAALEAIQRKPAAATIELVVRTDPARGVEVSSTVQAAGGGVKAGEVVVVVVATQNGLASRVTAGENRGERLAHDFVVRDFVVHRGMGTATSVFRPAAGWDLARMRIAAFVQNPRTGEILQAVSTPACA